MSEIRKTVISGLAVLVALVAATGWTFIGWRKCSRAETDLQTKQTQVTTLREKIARIPELRQEKNKLQDELAEYETILPKDRELDKIFDTLSDFTKDSGVTILEFKPERERQDKQTDSASSYKQVSYHLTLQGDFFQISKFINLLENYKRFVRVDSFDMTKADLDKPLGDTAIQISTFVYDPKSETGVRKRAAAKPTATRGAKKETAAPQTIPFVLADERAKQYVVFAGQTGSNGRDPFTNPLTKRHTEEVKRDLIPQGTPKTLTPAEEQDLVQTLQQGLAEVSDLIKGGDFEKASEVYTSIQDKLSCRFREASLEPQVASIRTRAAEIGELLKSGRGKRLYELVASQYDRMKQAFEVADYEGVTKISKNAAEVLKKAEGVTYEGLPGLSKSIKELTDRAAVCAEFMALNVDIQGVIWTRDGRAAAIINGQSLIEGDKLKFEAGSAKGPKQSHADPEVVGTGKLPQGDNDVFIHKITRDKITFRYKGERIDKVLVE